MDKQATKKAVSMKARYIYLILVGALTLIAAAMASLYKFNQDLESALNFEAPIEITVKKGETASHVVNQLYRLGLVDSTLSYKVMLKLKPALAQIKSGTYEVTPGMSGKDLLLMMAAGEEKQFAVRLVEGLTWREWLSYMNQLEFLLPDARSHSEWVASLDTPPQGDSLEGWLLPDTYYVTKGTSVADVVNRAYAQMQSYLEQAWLNRALDLPYEDKYQALIMASIIEKETGLAEERPRIAGVFVNRLRQNMRLQTDPTVIYGMGVNFDGNIRKKDLRQATPYNTYVIKGLPPTPIAMPGKLAIDAAMHPLETDELYFVSRGDGSHQFSTTLAEHNQAVRKYQLKQ